MKIGVFDSGLGGLIILKDIIKQLPQYEYIYLGDNARTPYGNRSQDVIYKFTEQAVDFLFKQDCQLVIIACNTASAEALRKLQQEWLPKKYPDRRILGVIRPVVEKVAKFAKDKVGVIGTKGTVNSEAYIKEINKLNSKLEVLQLATPLLVPLIEEGLIKSDITKKVLRKYLNKLKLAKIDTLILGCTHYPILLKQIKNIMGKRTNVLNLGDIVAESLIDYLARHPEIESKLTKTNTPESQTDISQLKTKKGIILKSGSVPFNVDFSQYKNLKLYITDDSSHYQQIAQNWFGQGIKFHKIELK